MPTWTQPTANALSASTYIKETDNKLQATMDDLEDFVNAAGTYVGAGLATDLVDKTTAQTIAGIKTFSDTPIFSAGLTGDVSGNATTATNLTSLVTPVSELNFLNGLTAQASELNVLNGVNGSLVVGEINYLVGVTGAIQTQLDNRLPLDGGTLIGQVKGITPISDEDLTRKDYVDTKAPLASPSLTGVPTTPTAVTTTNTTQIASTAFVQQEITANSIGVSQSWQDVTASRSSGTTYTNNTGKPIMVTVFIEDTGGSGTADFLVGSIKVADGAWTSVYPRISISTIVPNLQTYTLTVTGSPSIATWTELR